MKKGSLVPSISGLLLLVVLASCAPPPTALPIAPPSAAPVATVTPAPTAEPPIPLKVGIFNFVSHAPIYFALAEGYFAEEGLEVELVSFTSSAEFVPALATGEIDVASFFLAASVFNAIREGINLKYVADKGFLDPDSCPSDAWVASKQALAAGLADPPTIKGKNVAVSLSGGTGAYSLDLLLAEGGLTPKDINSVNITDFAARVEGLRNGSLDVAHLPEPWITVAQSSGAGEIWVPFSEVMPHLPMGIIVYGPSILDENREAGVRFMTAFLRGVEQYNEGKTDRNVELIAEFTKLAPEVVKAACWTSIRADGSVDAEGMLAFQQWLLENGMVDEVLELDQFWTDQFLVEAAKRLGR